MATTYPPAGLIGLTSISGSTGKLIEFGQWLNGDGFAQWEHAFMSVGDGLVVEAEPGGARVAHSSKYAVVHWCYGLYKLGTVRQNENAALAAKRYVGVPYSAADYFALAAHRLHVPVPGLQGYVSSSGHMICSQLVDQADTDAGIHLFADNRWPGDVDPLSLYNRDLEMSK
jgi:hypothetical protein